MLSPRADSQPLRFVAEAYRDDLIMDGGLLRDACARLYCRPWDKVPADEQGNL
jgi:tRNA(adenine34) deaminase